MLVSKAGTFYDRWRISANMVLLDPIQLFSALDSGIYGMSMRYSSYYVTFIPGIARVGRLMRDQSTVHLYQNSSEASLGDDVPITSDVINFRFLLLYLVYSSGLSTIIHYA